MKRENLSPFTKDFRALEQFMRNISLFANLHLCGLTFKVVANDAPLFAAINIALPQTTCTHLNDFQCTSGACLPFNRTCDGRNNCEDGADEDPKYCGASKV